MANTYVNKVVINGVTKIDLTQDDVTAETLLSGKKAHDKSGAVITGTMPSLQDATADATASASDILKNSTAYVNGVKITGSMPNIGKQEIGISDLTAKTITLGYHDGSGSAQITSTERAKIVGTNIRQGVTILGVVGTMSGSEDVKAQAKTATPSFTQQVITPDTTSGYNYLTQVTVNVIPVTYADNPQGGQTCTVG